MKLCISAVFTVSKSLHDWVIHNMTDTSFFGAFLVFTIRITISYRDQVSRCVSYRDQSIAMRIVSWKSGIVTLPIHWSGNSIIYVCIGRLYTPLVICHYRASIFYDNKMWCIYDLRLCMVEIGIVSVCGNTMCYLNYREAEVQVLKRT